MRDWLMENGERTSVMGDFAYDTDNDAWCELGSTEGSTPVWWRGRSRSSRFPSRQSKEEMLKSSLEKRKRELAEAQKREQLEQQLAEARKRSSSRSTLYDDMAGLNIMCVLGAIGFYVTFSHAPERYATAVTAITLVILVPVALSLISFCFDKVRQPAIEANRKRVRELEAELKELRGRGSHYTRSSDEISNDIAQIENELEALDKAE